MLFSLFLTANEKSPLPKLDDKVYCLKGIAKGGVYHKRLEQKNICTVQDFLKAFNRDPDQLRQVNILMFFSENMFQIKREIGLEKMVAKPFFFKASCRTCFMKSLMRPFAQWHAGSEY